MVLVSVEVDTAGILDKLSPDKVSQVKEKGLSYASQEMIRVLQRNSPVDHGLLKQWFLESLDENEAVIKSPAVYARWVNDGTPPYTIEPVTRKALYWEGADHPVTVVHHPGIKGQHFVEDSISDVEGRLSDYFLKALSEVMG